MKSKSKNQRDLLPRTAAIADAAQISSGDVLGKSGLIFMQER
jgi:hypothetical protein